MFRWLIVFCVFITTGMVKAEDRPSAILVLDASGSMWGQIDGLAKISIAQEVIGGLLQELPPEQVLGLTVYGHRRKGDCGDIETLIQPEGDQRAAILNVVRGIKPKGKTPLSAAVIQAAEALRYTEEAATVILVSDGRETCDYDPCEVGRQLEDAGIDFTAHVIGFDVANLSDRIQLQCLAEETGGTFRTASDASELADALLIVAEPPAAPEPVSIRYQAVITEDGSAITDELVWDVYDADGAAIVSNNVIASDTVTVDPGEYRIEVLRPEDEAFASKVVQINYAGQAVVLKLPLIQKLATVMAPETAVAGSMVMVEWTGPNEKDDYISVTTIDGRDGTWEEYTYTKVGTPLGLRMPATPGEYEIRYVLSKGRKDLATRRIKVTEIAATLAAPSELLAGSTVDVAWTGPNYPQDYMRVSDLLCMSNSVHVSSTKEHEDNDDYEGSIRRAA